MGGREEQFTCSLQDYRRVRRMLVYYSYFVPRSRRKDAESRKRRGTRRAVTEENAERERLAVLGPKAGRNLVLRRRRDEREPRLRRLTPRSVAQPTDPSEREAAALES